ncbi:MAG: methylmalonyl-CoA mutase [Chloroflexi bacterium]|nr:methylmalonyl-CoA mutase [Chloroflexota bacterium]
MTGKDDELARIEAKQKEWEETTLKDSLKTSSEREFSSEFPKERLYTPKDIADSDYLRDLGFPGAYPYTRGIHPTMFRSRLWGMAQYSGFGTPEDTNKRFKFLLSQGQTGVSLACDLPTQLGYDPDDPLAESEVGVVGVSMPSLREAEIVFDGIPLDRTSIRGSICHPHMVIWAMYMAVAEKQGVPANKLSGTVHNDVLQEYLGRGAYIFPPRGAMRLTLDFIEYSVKNIPKLSYLVNAYTIRESGGTLIQEGAYAMAAAIAFMQAGLEKDISIDDIAPRLSFNSAVHMDFFDEVAKFRAWRRLWAKTLTERFGAKKPASARLSVGPGTGGSTFTAQEPENNIVRGAIEALAAILGGVTYLHVAAFDEAHAIPTEKSAALALWTQQLIAYESGVTEVVDPLGGSYYVEALTNRIEQEISDYLREIESHGGIVKAIESGWMQAEISQSAYIKQKEIDAGKRIIVGVNNSVTKEPPAFDVHKSDPSVAEEMKRRVIKLKQERDSARVQQTLDALRKAAQGKENLVPFTLDAVKSYATIGEICGVLRQVLGEYQSPVF